MSNVSEEALVALTDACNSMIEEDVPAGRLIGRRRVYRGHIICDWLDTLFEGALDGDDVTNALWKLAQLANDQEALAQLSEGTVHKFGHLAFTLGRLYEREMCSHTEKGDSK